MKIVLESGEHILIVVPARTGSSAAVAIETDFGSKVTEISTESGLIDNITEHVAHRRDVPKVKEDKLKLWAHIVSKHACRMGTDAPLKELLDFHDREHHGPGGIRNHPVADRSSSLMRISHVLGEGECDDDAPRTVPASMIDNNNAVELPKNVIDDLKLIPGQTVYFVKSNGEYRLVNEQAMYVSIDS